MLHGRSSKAIRLDKTEVYDYMEDDGQPCEKAMIFFRHRAYTYPLFLDNQKTSKVDSYTEFLKC